MGVCVDHRIGGIRDGLGWGWHLHRHCGILKRVKMRREVNGREEKKRKGRGGEEWRGGSMRVREKKRKERREKSKDRSERGSEE